MKCGFCGREGSVPCTWQTWKFFPTTLGKVQVGDTIRTWNTLAITIAKIEPLPLEKVPQGWSGFRNDLIKLGYRRSGKLFESVMDPNFQCSVLRPARCEQPACELHVRDVGGNHRYCSEHWDAWAQSEQEQISAIVLVVT